MIKKYFFLIILTLTILLSCGQKEGITLSGYKYQMIKSNKGHTPQPGQIVYYHVTTMADDKVIKTTRSQERPQVFEMEEDQKLMELESPFLDILKYLSIGDSAVVFQTVASGKRLPSEYGDAEEVVYGVYLENIITQEEYETDRDKERTELQADKQTYREKEPRAQQAMDSLFSKDKESRLEDFITTESGLKYKILKQGSSSVLAEDGKHIIDLSYYGCLSSGKKFESSYKYGIPYRFVKGSGNIMPGWNEAAGLLTEGTESIIFVPSNLAFGERAFKGNVDIPANEDLYFHFVIEEVMEKTR